jgi:hypothetical protein
MASPNNTRTELEAQRCLIEQQDIQIRRLLRQMEVQMRFTAYLQNEINDLKMSVQPAAPAFRLVRDSQRNGNGRREERHLSNETMSRRDQRN